MSFEEYFAHVKEALTVPETIGQKYGLEIGQAENPNDIEVHISSCPQIKVIAFLVEMED